MTTEVIGHETTGLLAESTEQWVACIERLLSEPDLARRLVAAGRETVRTKYSLEACSPILAGVLHSIVVP